MYVSMAEIFKKHIECCIYNNMYINVICSFKNIYTLPLGAPPLCVCLCVEGRSTHTHTTAVSREEISPFRKLEE